MALLDVFRVGQIKTELEQTKADRDALKATISDTGHMDHYAMQKALADLGQRKDVLIQEITELEINIAKQKQWWEQKVAQTQREIEAARKELVVIDDAILLESFGLYKPTYDLANAEAYKARLDHIRTLQEDMVKNGRAAHCPTSWTVNNSQKEGERMIKDYVKLIIRSFNNECDASIVSVKFNNIETIEKRIRKAFETLNTLGKRMSISIVPEFLHLKLEELHLCHEYQLKRQQEKEEQKRIREQMREEAKVQKEIEEIKLKIAKEEKHFVNALTTINAQIQRVTNDAERALLEKEKGAIEQRLGEIERGKQEVITRERNTRAGYVYIISNLGSFGEHVYKIGVTRRLDPQERIDELGDASVPFDFDIHAVIFSDDAPALENALHRAFEHRRLNRINRRREFFRVTLDEIEQVVRTNFNKPVEMVRLADAAEYRQSVAIEG